MADARSPLAHHFDDLGQQRRAAELGMWLFLTTEILFFGGMLAGYTVYRAEYEASGSAKNAFAEASQHSDLVLGTINTAVLLTSSLAMALAVHFAEHGRRLPLVWSLVATIVLGAAFLGIKGIEYYRHYQEGLAPLLDIHFNWSDPTTYRGAQIFFGLYFLMTGVHALHMVIGLVLLAVLAVLAARGGLLNERSTAVHVSGLYWHFVDIVWVFLFPFLYLIGARGASHG